jgi:hypothetical protein
MLSSSVCLTAKRRPFVSQTYCLPLVAFFVLKIARVSSRYELTRVWRDKRLHEFD